MMQDKRRKVDDQEEADEEDEQVEAVLAKALDFQDQLNTITDEASDKVLAIEVEYTKKRRPVYKQRAEVLKDIPHFWVVTLSRHPAIASMLTEDDLEVLKYCIDVDVEDFDDIKSGFKITLRFSEDNPYFDNAELVKSFHYAEDASLSIKGTQPNWSKGNGPEDSAVGSKRVRRQYRFMLWFMDEELQPGAHDELADLIKDEIWINPVRFYTGEAAQDFGEDVVEEVEEEALDGAYEEEGAEEEEEGEAEGGEEGEGEAGEEEGE